MTQEEKAKAYDELKVKASRIYNKENDVLIMHTLEDLFPELAESEDEKIRKALIRFHKSTIDVDGIKGDDIIAWLENIPYTIDHEKREGFHLGYKAGLEKQGDSPVKWNKNNEGNKPQVNHSILMKTTQGIAEGEWKGEYWEQYRWAGIVRDSDVLSWMELSSLEKQGEQKPTLRERYKNIAESEWFKKTHDGMSVSNDEEPKWTDDDFNDSSEKKVQAKSLWHDCYYPKDKDRLFLLISKDKRASIMSWNGKSLKSVTFGGGGGIILEGDRFAYIDDLEKQGEQASAWSEEDECYMGECISAIATKDSWSFEEKRKTKHWLKSLKERYTWKPSIAQLNALSIVSKGNAPDDIEAIMSLYNDLKKLREE